MGSWFQCFTGGQPVHEQQQQHQLGQHYQQLHHPQAIPAAFDDTVGPHGGAFTPSAAKVLVSVSSQTDEVQQLYQQQHFPGHHVGKLGTGRAHAELDQEGAMELGSSSYLPNVLSQQATAFSVDNLQRTQHGGSTELTASGSVRPQPQPMYSSEIQGAGSLSLQDSSAYGSPGGSVSRCSEGLPAGRLTPKPDPAASNTGSQDPNSGPDLPRSSETEDSSCVGGSASRLSEDVAYDGGSHLGRAIRNASQVAAVKRVVAADAAKQAMLTEAELSQAVNEEADAVGELGINLNVNWDRQIKLGRVIGSGNYGVVHEAWYRGRRVAVKCLSKVGVNAASTKEDLDIFRSEMKIMVRLHHPNIVSCYGGNLTPPRVFLVQEIMCCNLFNYIYHPDADVSLRVLLCIARDIAMGLTYLHPTVLHRDLKPANILLGQHGVAKISDFGLARSKERTFLTTKTLEAGTVPYMAPECFNVSITHLSDRCDVYSLAVVIWELLVRAPPWHGMRDLAVAYAVTVDNKRLPMPASDRCPPRLDKLISACWQTEPMSRPCAAEVVAELDVLLTELGGPPSQLCK